MAPTLAELAKMIDHSLLQPTLTDADMSARAGGGIEYNVASVCIKPYALKLAAKRLQGTTIAASTVIGFPHGGHVTGVKVFESQQALADGATELDMVANIGKVLSGDWNYVADDIGDADASLARRVLRSRQGQDAQLGKIFSPRA